MKTNPRRGKMWIIYGPDGTTQVVRNLSEWRRKMGFSHDNLIYHTNSRGYRAHIANEEEIAAHTVAAE